MGRYNFKYMIFSLNRHIDKIITGEKTQTRRRNDYFSEDRSYVLQHGRGKAGIKDGKIRVTKLVEEKRGSIISPEDSYAEGGYTPEEFEALYEKMYPNWKKRYAYYFEYIPMEEIDVDKP